MPVNAANVEPTPQASLKHSLWALGIFGQMIMVNQAENLVIVQWSTAAGGAVLQRSTAGGLADVQRDSAGIALIPRNEQGRMAVAIRPVRRSWTYRDV